MSHDSSRLNLYLDPDVLAGARLKATSTGRSLSEVVNDALRAALREDEEDLASFDERADETPVSYEDFLAQLATDGELGGARHRGGGDDGD